MVLYGEGAGNEMFDEKGFVNGNHFCDRNKLLKKKKKVSMEGIKMYGEREEFT